MIASQALRARSIAGLVALLVPCFARAEEPADVVDPQPYLVRVHLVGDRPDFKLQLTLARIGADDVPLCTEPCDRALSIKPYQRFLLAPDHASGAVNIAYEEIPPFALPADQPGVLIRVQSGKPERRIAGAFVLGGGLVVTGAGLLTGLGAQIAISVSDQIDHKTAQTVRNAGVITGGAGLLIALAGLVLIELSPAPSATIEPLN